MISVRNNQHILSTQLCEPLLKNLSTMKVCKGHEIAMTAYLGNLKTGLNMKFRDFDHIRSEFRRLSHHHAIAQTKVSLSREKFPREYQIPETSRK